MYYVLVTLSVSCITVVSSPTIMVASKRLINPSLNWVIPDSLTVSGLQTIGPIIYPKSGLKYSGTPLNDHLRITTTPIFRPPSKSPAQLLLIDIIINTFQKYDHPEITVIFLVPWVVVILRFHCMCFSVDMCFDGWEGPLGVCNDTSLK